MTLCTFLLRISTRGFLQWTYPNEEPDLCSQAQIPHVGTTEHIGLRYRQVCCAHNDCITYSDIKSKLHSFYVQKCFISTY